MQKILFTSILLCLPGLSALAQKPFLLNDWIPSLKAVVSIKFPAALKFHERINNSEPVLMTTDNGDARLTFSAGTSELTDNDIPAFADDQLKLARQDDESFEYIDDGIHLQDGKNIGYLKFSTKEAGKKYFNYTFFISIDDKPLLFTFCCLLKDRKKWEPIADAIANSLRIKA